MISKRIFFDMDGTLNRFYDVENWLDYLLNEDAYPYEAAKPMLNMSLLARYLNKLRAQGWEIGVISWLSKNSTPSYDEKVTAAKLTWLNKHLTSVEWTEINIVAYGTNKYEYCGGGILFDDEQKNRDDWKDEAYEPSQILNILKGLIQHG